MRELCPEISSHIRYWVRDINRYADLYFNLNGEELIVEFQRTNLHGQVFEEKLADYNRVNINNLWLLSGNEDEVERMVREHNLTFFQRLNLNENKKEVYFIDVENRRIYIMKKMIYIDEEIKETIMDKIFYRDYDLDEIVINLELY